MQKSERDALVDMLMNRAPDQDARDKVEAFVGEVTHELDRSDEAMLSLVNALHDGLAYGNWPWTFR